MIVYYEVYAERNSGGCNVDYGRTQYGNFLKEENAIKHKEKLMKKYVGKGEKYQDGYFENDWDIEVHNIFLEDEKNEKEGTMTETEKAIKFVKHIENHLKELNIHEGKVLCKICGKDIDEIGEEE